MWHRSRYLQQITTFLSLLPLLLQYCHKCHIFVSKYNNLKQFCDETEIYPPAYPGTVCYPKRKSPKIKQ